MLYFLLLATIQLIPRDHVRVAAPPVAVEGAHDHELCLGRDAQVFAGGFWAPPAAIEVTCVRVRRGRP